MFLEQTSESEIAIPLDLSDFQHNFQTTIGGPLYLPAVLLF
jgi:hypothetical protein